MPKLSSSLSISFLAIIAFAGISVGNFGGVGPTIVWSPDQIAQDQFSGTAKVINATFASRQDLDNVEFWITPELNKYAVVEPESIEKVEKDKEYNINVIVSLSTDLHNKQFLEKDIEALLGDRANQADKDFLKRWDRNKITGLLFVKSDKTVPWFQFWKDKDKAIKILRPKPLRIVVNIKEPSAEVIPVDEVSLPILERIYEDEETGAVYVRDEVIIRFKENVSETRREEIISSINGRVLGYISDIEIYQVLVPATDPTELEQIIQQIETYSGVITATHHWMDSID